MSDLVPSFIVSYTTTSTATVTAFSGGGDKRFVSSNITKSVGLGTEAPAQGWAVVSILTKGVKSLNDQEAGFITGLGSFATVLVEDRANPLKLAVGSTGVSVSEGVTVPRYTRFGGSASWA
jgi:hypothetical protein